MPAILLALAAGFVWSQADSRPDPIAELQQSHHDGTAEKLLAYWGPDPNEYEGWGSHSNRLVPVYAFGTRGAAPGVDLKDYSGEKSKYRSADELEKLYGREPDATLAADAEYMDQTDIYRIQRAALENGRRFIFLVVFDGMGWESTRAGAVARTASAYKSGRGSGLFLLDYDANGTSQYALMATSPYADRAKVDVETQTVARCEPEGGYDPRRAGFAPWEKMSDAEYIISRGDGAHPYTDSAASATSMTSGAKTFNGSVNMGPKGERLESIAHLAQREGFLVGAVSSVPISHATPAAAYAHNVSRDDYKNIARDLLGLPSASHPSDPMPGLDLLLGAGLGDVPVGNGEEIVLESKYIDGADVKKVDVDHGGRYRVVGTNPMDNDVSLDAAAEKAGKEKQRLLGLFGDRTDHLPYRTANGDYSPRSARRSAEAYSADSLKRNPTLEEMTNAALKYMTLRKRPFWLMVEAGDVDWAMHDNNLDNMIGAVHSGDDAVKAICQWVEANSSWDESLLIVTADHDHYLTIADIEAFADLAAGR